MTFEEFARQRLPALLAFATVLTGDPAVAEDLAQEVLIRASSRWIQIGGLDRPDLYVRKMLLNEFLSWRRRSWRLIPVGDAPEPGGGTPDHAVSYAEHADLLAAIARLPKRQRAVLALRYYEDRSDAEIAELLGCTPSSVRGYASRAFAALRIELRPEAPERPRAASRIHGGS